MPVRKAPEDAASPPQNGSATGGRVPAGREVTRWPRHLSPESPARWPSLTQHPSDAAGGAGQTVAPSAPDPPDPPPRPWGLGDDCSSPQGGQATAGSPPHPVAPRCCGVLSAAFPAPTSALSRSACGAGASLQRQHLEWVTQAPAGPAAGPGRLSLAIEDVQAGRSQTAVAERWRGCETGVTWGWWAHSLARALGTLRGCVSTCRYPVPIPAPPL